MNKFIAIDFDGTITDNTPYPNTGNIRPEAAYYIKKLYDTGYVLFLWTCRYDKYLEEAIKLLADNNLLKYFKNINSDIVNNSRKIIADFYIDDRSIPGELDWHIIYKYIIENIK